MLKKLYLNKDYTTDYHYWLYPVWLCMWQIIKNLEHENVSYLLNI